MTNRLLSALSLVALLLLAGCTGRSSAPPFDLSQASYVGRENCVSCHQEQADSYAGSHHDLAMQLATDETVLADFENVIFEHHGIESRFFRDGASFMVHTEGPDGQMSDFEVKYVFGLEPLQQYMVELPADSNSVGKVGDSSEVAPDLPRIQVLRLSWDTERNEWFYLPPPDVEERLEPTDELHWTGIAQRWNNMCADCHSTDYRKNFEIPHAELRQVVNHGSSDGAGNATGGFPDHVEMMGQYHSTFREIDVSCEACHGPGSVHVELAQQWFPGWNRERGYGLANLKLSSEHQIQACAPCHSRRNVVQGGFRAGEDFYDYYSNQLLTSGIYYPDGQILDEDYVHGSFLQSKMYHKGIQCTDCHDPHTARLKHNGNQVCTSCQWDPLESTCRHASLSIL